MMIDSIEKHMITDKEQIAWRFDSDIEILEKIDILDKEFSDRLWNKLINDKIVDKFSLFENKFKKFEEKHFDNNYNWITNRLKELSKLDDRVLITWSDGIVLETIYKNFIDNWELFYNPSADDLFVINNESDWIICLTHFELFQCGQKLMK